MKNWEVWAKTDRTATMGDMLRVLAEKVLEEDEMISNRDFAGADRYDKYIDMMYELIQRLFGIDSDRLDDILGYEINDLCEEARK